MASPPSTSSIEEKADSPRACGNETSTPKRKSAPGTPRKPPVAAKPSRRPAPPPPPPKPQSLNVAISPIGTKSSSSTHRKEETSGLENGTATASKELPGQDQALAEATCNADPLQRPPLPTSPPPVQRKGPLSPSSSASLPASFRPQTAKSARKHSSAQLKNSPSLPTVPPPDTLAVSLHPPVAYSQTASPHPPAPQSQAVLPHRPAAQSQTAQQAQSCSSSPSAKASPAKPPKPVVPPKIAIKSKKINSRLRPDKLPSNQTSPQSKPDTPLSNQASPCAKPDSHPSNQTSPQSKPDTPLSNQASPCAKPDSHPSNQTSPQSKPDTPLSNQASPCTKPDSHPSNQTSPQSKPDTPLSNQASPCAKPDSHPSNQASPQSKTDTPVSNEMSPFSKPDTHLSNEASHCTKYDTPLSNQASPCSKPDTPLSNQASHCTKSGTPLSNQASPCSKPDTLPSNQTSSHVQPILSTSSQSQLLRSSSASSEVLPVKLPETLADCEQEHNKISIALEDTQSTVSEASCKSSSPCVSPSNTQVPTESPSPAFSNRSGLESSSLPSVPDKCSHFLVTSLDSGTVDPDLSKETPKKPPPPPLPKNPPRGGLPPRKLRASVGKKQPDKPASDLEPAVTPAAVVGNCQHQEVLGSHPNEISLPGRGSQVTSQQATPPRPRPRKSLSISSKHQVEEKQEAGFSTEDRLEDCETSHLDSPLGDSESSHSARSTKGRLGDSGANRSDSPPQTGGPSTELPKSPELNQALSDCPQPEPELDYVEVYRGEDGERHLLTAPYNEAGLNGHENCGVISSSASQDSLGSRSQHTEEPEPTCGMLKEIEDLLNKKLEDLDPSEASAELSEAEVKDITSDNSFVSLTSSPVRPPRPKHQASLALRKGSMDSLNLSRESLTDTEKKVAPPKPKRSSTPRVSRSQSDASGLRSPMTDDPTSDGAGDKPFPQIQPNGKPYLPPRSESLRKNDSLLCGNDSPPPLPPRNRSRSGIELSPHLEVPPLPERVSLILTTQTESQSLSSSLSPADDQHSQEDVRDKKKSTPQCLTAPSSDGETGSNPTSSQWSPNLRPARKAPPPPPSSFPRRSATFGPSDTKPLTASDASLNVQRVTPSTSSEEPDYHEIPPEGLMGKSDNVAPRLPPRVSRSKSLCSKEVTELKLSVADSKGGEKKSSSLERHSSLKFKSRKQEQKDEQQAREKKAKSALIQRVTQGLGLKKTFRKSKSPESLSSNTSHSSSELEVEALSSPQPGPSRADCSETRSLSQPGNSLQRQDSGQSVSYENDSAFVEPVTVKVCSMDVQDKEKESELPSPAMERLGMEDLESEVMSALSSGGISTRLGQPVANSNEGRPRSYRSTSTSSEREAGDEGQEDQDPEGISSASDSEPEPELDKEEIYTVHDTHKLPHPVRSAHLVRSSYRQAIRKAKKVFFIAKEIMSSESVFVDVLKLLNVDFRVHISKATEKLGQPVIPTVIMNKILAYLPQLQDFNEDLLKDLSERVKNWEENPRLADIFVKKGPFLKLYSSYIRNFETSTSTLDEALKKHGQFAAALKEFEMSPRCASLALRHYMLKPIQRIPQYKLLLQDYLKQLTPASADFKDTIAALNIVSEVADHANESMRHGDNVQKLLEIQRSLIGSFEVIQPGRVLVLQGELEKVSRKEMQPRMFFLFSDVLLYTTPVTTGNKINNILPLIGMKVISPKLEDHDNEFNIISVQRSFTLCASTPELKQQWVEALQKAIEENAKRHNTFESVKQRPQTSLLDKDFVLGHKAPLWVPDARVTMCMLCLVEFTLTWRRHHCRSCGRIICAQCSQNKAPLQYLKYKPSRVCDECFDKLKEDVTKEVANEKNKKRKKSNVADPEEESSVSVSEDRTSSSLARDDLDGDEDDQSAGDTEDGAGPEQHESGLTLNSLLGRFTKIRSSNNRTPRKPGNFRPSVLKEVRANDEGSDMSGYLHTFKSRKWKKMWFVVKGKVLYTYRASADMAAVESMPLLGYEVSKFETIFEGTEPGLLIELRHQNNQPLTSSRASKSLAGSGRAMQRTVLRTESLAATSKWVAVLREASQT